MVGMDPEVVPDGLAWVGRLGPDRPRLGGVGQPLTLGPPGLPVTLCGYNNAPLDVVGEAERAYDCGAVAEFHIRWAEAGSFSSACEPHLVTIRYKWADSVIGVHRLGPDCIGGSHWLGERCGEGEAVSAEL